MTLIVKTFPKPQTITIKIKKNNCEFVNHYQLCALKKIH